MLRNLLKMAITVLATLVFALTLGGVAWADDGKEGPSEGACGFSWWLLTSPSQSGNTYLNDVATIDQNDAWAVGYAVGAGGVLKTHIQHWNGTTWSIAPSPSVGNDNNYLFAVAALSANDVWAAGYYEVGINNKALILHWNGGSWTVVSSMVDGELYDLAFSSGSDGWAVGGKPVNLENKTLTMRWDGSTWAVVSSPNVGNEPNNLRGVATMSGQTWAVGSYVGSGGIRQSLALQFTEGSWGIVGDLPALGTGPHYLNKVEITPGGTIWAVGANTSAGYRTTLILRYMGGIWATVASPNLSNRNNELDDIAVASENNIWAVGYRNEMNNTTISYPLALRWNGTAWSATGTLTPGTTVSVFKGVDIANSNDVWAVGYYNEGADTARTMVQKWRDPCACVVYTDVPADNTFYFAIRDLSCGGIMSGYADGTFRPNANITRGQLSKIVSNVLGLNNPPGSRLFEDVAPGSTFYDYIQRLAQLGVIGGYPCGGPGEPCSPNGYPYFRPNANATRGQIAKIVSNAAGADEPPGAQIFEDVPPASTFYSFIQRLANRGAMSGYSCGGPGEPCGAGNKPYFRPNNNATRGQVSKIVYITFYP